MELYVTLGNDVPLQYLHLEVKIFLNEKNQSLPTTEVVKESAQSFEKR